MKQIVDKLNKIAQAIDESVELPTSDLIIDSLDAITTAYGGTPNDSKLIVDKLEDIAGVAHSGITPSGIIEITENTTEGELLDISQYAAAAVNVPSSGVDFVIPEQTVTTLASGNVPIQTNFPTEFPTNIVIQMMGEAFGQPIHGLAVMTHSSEDSFEGYRTVIGFDTSTISINIVSVDSGENWGMNIQVNNYQTAFTDILISAIAEWETTPV